MHTPWAEMPPDLLFRGKPIHPSIVIRTQSGDSSRFDPQPLFYDPKKAGNCFESITNEEIIEHSLKNTYSYRQRYFYPFDEQKREYEIFDSYTYIRTFGDRHLILGHTYDTSGTGRFNFLGFVKRKGDYLVNAGELAGGDRECGSDINVISIENNLIRITQNAQFDRIMQFFAGQNFDLYYPPIERGGVLHYEYDVNNEQQGLIITGLSLPAGNTIPKEDFNKSKESRFKYCFLQVSKNYCEAGKTKLTVTEAEQFAQDVMNLFNIHSKQHEV